MLPNYQTSASHGKTHWQGSEDPQAESLQGRGLARRVTSPAQQWSPGIDSGAPRDPGGQRGPVPREDPPQGLEPCRGCRDLVGGILAGGRCVGGAGAWRPAASATGAEASRRWGRPLWSAACPAEASVRMAIGDRRGFWAPLGVRGRCVAGAWRRAAPTTRTEAPGRWFRAPARVDCRPHGPEVSVRLAGNGCENLVSGRRAAGRPGHARRGLGPMGSASVDCRYHGPEASVRLAGGERQGWVGARRGGGPPRPCAPRPWVDGVGWVACLQVLRLVDGLVGGLASGQLLFGWVETCIVSNWSGEASGWPAG